MKSHVTTHRNFPLLKNKIPIITIILQHFQGVKLKIMWSIEICWKCKLLQIIDNYYNYDYLSHFYTISQKSERIHVGFEIAN